MLSSVYTTYLIKVVNLQLLLCPLHGCPFQYTWALTPHGRTQGCPLQSILGCPIAAPLHIPSLPLSVLKPCARCHMDTLCCPLGSETLHQTTTAAPVWTPSLSQSQYLKLGNHCFSTEAVFKENHAKANFLGRSYKESACQCRRHKRCEFDSWVGKIL